MFALLAHSAAENAGRPRPSAAAVPGDAAVRPRLLGCAQRAPVLPGEPFPARSAGTATSPRSRHLSGRQQGWSR